MANGYGGYNLLWFNIRSLDNFERCSLWRQRPSLVYISLYNNKIMRLVDLLVLDFFLVGGDCAP